MADGAAGTTGRFREPHEWLVLWRRLNPDYRCRFCGECAWDTLAAPQSGLAGALHYLTFPEGSPAMALKAVPFNCGNCGMIELFAETELLKLARARNVIDE